jgi:hypothetical protein
MMKAVVLIRRKPGVSKAEFQAHYEAHHAPLAMTYISPFLVDYRRSYPLEAFSYADAVDDVEPANGSEFGYDCITELWFADRAQMDAMLAVLADPSVRDVLTEDEDRFLDRDTIVFLPCSETRTLI